MTTPPKKTSKPRKKLSVEEQLEKLEADKKKLQDRENKLKAEALVDFIKKLKLTDIESLFDVTVANNKDVSKTDVLRAIASAVNLKVEIKAVKTKSYYKPKSKAAKKSS